jgi:glycosyltransferase involved in cell wall biosynthesis
MNEIGNKVLMHSKEKRLLHVVNISFVVPYFIGNQVDYLHSLGYSVSVACSPSQHFSDYAKEKNFIPFPINIQRSFSIINDLKSVVKLICFIKKNKISVVIGHTPKGGIIAMYAAKLAGVKKRIYFRHGIMFETATGNKRKFLMMIERFTGALATKVVCVSRSVMEVSDQERLSAAHKNLILGDGTCNGIDCNFFSRNTINQLVLTNMFHKFRIEPGSFVIGFVGRLAKDKGIEELVHSFEIVQKDLPGVCLLLVGPMEERDEISSGTAEKIKTNPGIIFTGFETEVRYFYAMMNVLILPSHREGFPTVVLEASAMNLPVITTRVTGCIDSIIENETGIFCDINVNDIAEKIKYYYQNPAIASQHAKNGCARVIQSFSQERVWQELKNKILND